MQRLLVICAALGLSATPAVAQSTSGQVSPNQAVNGTASSQANTAPAPQQKTVKKTVCEKVEVERSTGSRLSSTTRICRTVEVPVTANDGQPHAANGSTR